MPFEIEDGLLVVRGGFADVHVHFREPGFEYKETMATGAAAAVHGGFTDVCAMPNLSPVPDSLDNLRVELDAIARCGADVRIHPFGALTVGERGGELADLEAMAPYVCGFSDDGRGVDDAGLMKEAMAAAGSLGKTISAHCEVRSVIPSGAAVHDGAYAAAHGLDGIPSASEWRMVERDLDLVRDTGCRYHVCHVSTKESLGIIRDAKADGLPVSCETAPHYLVLCEDDLRDDGSFKMNPPLRLAADRDALVEGLADGSIDCVATDHAPHSAEEKSRGLAGSAFGIVGLECAFPVLYTSLVETGLVPLERLVDAMSSRPRSIFGLRSGDGDFTEIAIGVEDRIDPSTFLSKGRSTPFEGMMVHARVLRTVHDASYSASMRKNAFVPDDGSR